jgi:hypothetical protein
MRVALCVTGFARIVHSADVIRRSLNRALPPDSIIDVFWACPKQLDPDNTDIRVDQTSLRNGFEDAGLRNLTLVWFDYTPSIFYDAAKQFSFAKEDVLQNRSIFRTMSQIYNISKSVQIAYDSGCRYDVVIITRNDYIPHVITYGITQIENGIYAYRMSPYRTTSHQVGLGGNFLDTEDRAFYGTHDAMMGFRYFYENLPKVYTSPKLYPEVLHTEFIRSMISEQSIYYQNGIFIQFPPNRTDTRLYKLNNIELQVINEQFNSH